MLLPRMPYIKPGGSSQSSVTHSKEKSVINRITKRNLTTDQIGSMKGLRPLGKLDWYTKKSYRSMKAVEARIEPIYRGDHGRQSWDNEAKAFCLSHLGGKG